MPTIKDLLKGPRDAAPDLTPKGRKHLKKMTEVVESEVDWVWRPYIPRSMVTMMTGDPAAGKGWVSAEIASALSVGRPLPGQGPLPPARTAIFSAEDNAEHVLAPRLRKQGADFSRVQYLDDVWNLTTPSGLEDFKGMLLDWRPLVAFIDPVTSFMGDQDPNKPTVVNEFLSRLAALARETKVAIVAVRHRRKPADGDRKGRDPKFGGLGSIGFQGGARSELLVGMTAEGQRAMSHEKSNVGPDGVTQKFSLDAEDGHLTWEGEDQEMSGWELVGRMKKRGAGRPPDRRDEVAAWLRSAVSAGPRPASEVYAEGEKMGYSRKTMALVKGVAGVRAYIAGGIWMLEGKPNA